MSKRLPNYPGFSPPTANFLLTPIQVFNLLLPHHSVHCIRIVSYMVRELIGWTNRRTKSFSRAELAKRSGVAKNHVTRGIAEAERARFIDEDIPGNFLVRWSQTYTHAPAEFDGFYFDGAEEGEAPTKRRAIPNDFFDIVIPREPKSVIRIVGFLLYHSMAWTRVGHQGDPRQRSKAELSRLTNQAESTVSRALKRAICSGYIFRERPGLFGAGPRTEATTYGIRWQEEEQTLPEMSPEVHGAKKGSLPKMGPRLSPKWAHGRPLFAPTVVPKSSPRTCPQNGPTKQKHLELEHTQQGGLGPVRVSLDEELRRLEDCLVEKGVSRKAAKRVIQDKAQQVGGKAALPLIENQLRWAPKRGFKHPGGLIQAIRDDYSEPQGSGEELGREAKPRRPAMAPEPAPDPLLEARWFDFLRTKREELCQDSTREQKFEQYLDTKRRAAEKLRVLDPRLFEQEEYQLTQLQQFLELPELEVWAKTQEGRAS